jgi:hypothetical protein
VTAGDRHPQQILASYAVFNGKFDKPELNLWGNLSFTHLEAREMRPLFESLEAREFLSASVVQHAVKAHHHKHHHKSEVIAAVAPTAPVAWNDLAGNWVGTFSNNISPPGAMSASFQNRQGESNTGTFNLSAMIGQSGLLTTTTPDAFGNVLITVPVKGGIVSFVAGISYDGKIFSGRWCTHIGTTFVTGTFTMHRT